MILTLPKVKRNGEFQPTVVKVADISGCERAVIDYDGKKWEGTKVFVQGGSFYVLAPLKMVASAMNGALLGNVQMVQKQLNPAPVAVISAPNKKYLPSKM